MSFMEYFPTPTRVISRTPSKLELSTDQIDEKLDEINDIKKIRRNIKELEQEHFVLFRDNKNEEAQKLVAKLELLTGEYDLFFQINETDDHEVVEAIEKRNARIESMEIRGCFPGYECNYNIPIYCVEAKEQLKKIEKKILCLRDEKYWSIHSLHEYKSSLEFPHPGFNQAAGDFIDVQSVVDRARPIALLGSEIRPSVGTLASLRNLSSLTARGSDKYTIFYDGQMDYELARHIAEIIETKGDESNDPDTVYSFHTRLGELMEIHPEAVERYARLKRDQVVTGLN